MANNQLTNKSALIGFGILLGLLFALVLYLLYENRELKEEIDTKAIGVETVQDDSGKTDVNASTDKTDLMESDPNEDASAESSIWQATKNINTFDGYLKFISSDDNDGTHEQESISKLMALGTTGWLYSGRTTDNENYSEDQMLLVNWRKGDESNLRRTLPEIGDLVTLKSKQARRTYPQFLPRDRQNGIWPLERQAFVLDVKMEGKTAVIVKVVY